MNANQKIVLAELIVFLVPVTALAIAMCGIALFAAIMGRPVEPKNIDMGALSFLSLLSLASAWRLTLAYLSGGVDKLASVHAVHLILTLVGAFIASAGLLAWAAGNIGVISPFFFGAPALVPFVHLAVVRFHARTGGKGR
jgi:hypothetical protein